MDASLYKTFTTSRSLTYNYYFSGPPPSSIKPYLLFLHGFPSTLKASWRHHIPYFQSLGYGVIAPDMLGYGKTSIPTDPTAYRGSLMAKDLIELLDQEGVEKVVGIGHDWGSLVLARMANYFPERFEAYVFLSVGYRVPPGLGPDGSYVSYEKTLDIVGSIINHSFLSSRFTNGFRPFVKQLKSTLGTELFGYWGFYASPDNVKIVENNMDAFLDLHFSENWKLSEEYLSPKGGVERWYSEGKRSKRGAFVSEEVFD
jgi:soluble epoxide hydrolase / lipid-phosphate phosphatase